MGTRSDRHGISPLQKSFHLFCCCSVYFFFYSFSCVCSTWSSWLRIEVHRWTMFRKLSLGNRVREDESKLGRNSCYGKVSCLNELVLIILCVVMTGRSCSIYVFLRKCHNSAEYKLRKQLKNDFLHKNLFKNISIVTILSGL